MKQSTQKPTDAQIKEFWIGVFGKEGVEFGTVVDGEVVCYRRTIWIEADEEWGIEVIPRTDSLEFLGYLFRHAVPSFEKVETPFGHHTGARIEFVRRDKDAEWRCLLGNYWTGMDVVGGIPNPFSDYVSHVDHPDIALALFWAIYPVFKATYNSKGKDWLPEYQAHFGNICDGCFDIRGINASEHRCHSWSVFNRKVSDFYMHKGERVNGECQCPQCRPANYTGKGGTK